MKKYIQIQVSNTFDYYHVNQLQYYDLEGDNRQERTIIDEMYLTNTLVKYHTLDSLVKTNFCKDNMGPFPILYNCKKRIHI